VRNEGSYCKSKVDADFSSHPVEIVGVSVVQVTGHFVSVAILERVGLGALCDQLLELVRRVRQLRLDANEYICLKYILLLNSGTQLTLSCGNSPATQSSWRLGVVASVVRRVNEVTVHWARLVLGWVTVHLLGGYTITVRKQPTRSTQPCIPPGSLNQVPALAGVKAGMSPLPDGR